uniref:Uncharacterized protein n=1 Tax=Otolemur garnettii TaxID=30611 RepID=H0XZY1_OTOGA
PRGGGQDAMGLAPGGGDELPRWPYHRGPYGPPAGGAPYGYFSPEGLPPGSPGGPYGGVAPGGFYGQPLPNSCDAQQPGLGQGGAPPSLWILRSTPRSMATTLNQAVVKSSWSSPHDDTTQEINMFAKSKSVHINVIFSVLWKFIQQGKSLFQQCGDHPGSLCHAELQQALPQMGHNLSPVIQLLVLHYCRHPANPARQLHHFIQARTQLQVPPEAFWKDTAAQGNIQPGFVDFGTMIQML